MLKTFKRRPTYRFGQPNIKQNNNLKIFKSLPTMSLALVVAGVLILNVSAVSVLHFTARNVSNNVAVVLGELPYQKLLPHALSKRANLLVNTANGNLLLQTQDLNINGTGPALSISRYFNDLASGSGQAGSHDTLSIGADVHITANSDGSATYQGPSGFKVNFPSDGNDGYRVPASYTAAKLTKTSNGWRSLHV
jgi:hypothetical protein